MPPRPDPRRTAPVLRLSEDRAEWLEPVGTGAGYGLARSTSAGAAALAEAAAAARELAEREAGSRAGSRAGPQRRPCVLALGGGLVRQRSLELPPLPPRERRGVCLRKAAGLLDAPIADTVFCASAGADTDGDRRRWLIACVRRSFLDELLRELSVRGVRVARVVCARQAALGLLSDADVSGAAIAIDAEPDELVVSLVADGRLAAQNVVPGHFDEGALNARMLLAEVRSQTAYRRITSHGDGVERVLLAGSAAERLAPLALVLRTVVPGAAIEIAGGDHGDGERRARAHVLDACRRRGPFELDLTPRLAPRRRHVAVWTALAAGIVLGLGSLAHARVAAELAGFDRRTAELVEAAERGAGAVDASARARASFERVAQGFESFRAVERAGWSLDDLLADALSALDDDAALRSLATDAAGEGAEVAIAAWTDGDVLRAAERAARVTAALEASVAFRSCTGEPEAASLRPDRPAHEPFAFRVRAESAAEAPGGTRKRERGR